MEKAKEDVIKLSMSSQYNQRSSKQKLLNLYLTNEKLPKMLAVLDKDEIMKDRSYVIADYGCAGGKNSFFIYDGIINYIHSLNPKKIIEIYMNDLPENDFSVTFEEAVQHYKDTDKVFLFGLGKSFYCQVLPENSVNVVISCYAVHWLQKFPSPLTDQYFGSNRVTNPEEYKAWAEQQSKDLNIFLSNRKKELIKGGHLFITILGNKGSDEVVFNQVQKHKVSVLTEMGLEKVAPHTLANFFLRDESDCNAVFEDLKESFDLKETSTIFHSAWKYDEAQGDEQLDAAIHSVVDSTECVTESVWSGSLVSKSDEFYGRKLTDNDARNIVKEVFARARKDLFFDFKQMKEIKACNIFCWAIAK